MISINRLQLINYYIEEKIDQTVIQDPEIKGLALDEQFIQIESQFFKINDMFILKTKELNQIALALQIIFNIKPNDCTPELVKEFMKPDPSVESTEWRAMFKECLHATDPSISPGKYLNEKYNLPEQLEIEEKYLPF